MYFSFVKFKRVESGALVIWHCRACLFPECSIDVPSNVDADICDSGDAVFVLEAISRLRSNVRIPVKIF